MIELQHEILKFEVEAKKIALKHFKSAIESGDSATVAAMAEILKS